MDIRINNDYLIKLAGSDSELVLSIMNDFENESEILIDTLSAKASESKLDLDALYGLLHKFKGSAASLGLVSLREVITELENGNDTVWENFDEHDLRMMLSRSIKLARKALA